jgi:antitoxin component YwqK of YwqJK toxin-antitoxin module
MYITIIKPDEEYENDKLINKPEIEFNDNYNNYDIEKGFLDSKKFNYRPDGEYKRYYYHENENKYHEKKVIEHYFYKNNKREGEYIKYYENKQVKISCYYNNDKLQGEYKYYLHNNKLITYSYYINDKMIIHKMKFNNIYALLKFKDILKSKYRKPIYKLLDNYFISDLSDIISSYLFTLSNLNKTNKRILL